MTKKTKGIEPQKPSTDLVKREFTDAEKASLEIWRERIKRTPVKVERAGKNGYAVVDEGGGIGKAMGIIKQTEAFGTPDQSLQNYLLNQLKGTFVGYDDSKMVTVFNDSLALLNGIQPRDEIEGMLAIQMIAVHNIAMETMRRAVTGQIISVIEGDVNNATKMLRTYTTQMEALKRYRTGGQQKVIVEHVNVNQGGQAIVGAVSTGGRGYGEQKHE